MEEQKKIQQMSLDLGDEIPLVDSGVSTRKILSYQKLPNGQPINVAIIDPLNITPREYSQAVLRTFNLKDKNALLDEAILGIGGEVGEVLNDWRKEKYQDHPRNINHLVEELGDVLCYLAVAAKALDVSLEYIMFENIKKKLKRYPNGFDPFNSINR